MGPLHFAFVAEKKAKEKAKMGQGARRAESWQTCQRTPHGHAISMAPKMELKHLPLCALGCPAQPQTIDSNEGLGVRVAGASRNTSPFGRLLHQFQIPER